jgi:NAD(P)H-dependent FMN reductase
VVIVSYGSRGGGKCAKQLRQVLKGMHAKLIPTMPGLRLTEDHIKANSGTIEPERVFAKHRKTLQSAFKELDAALDGRRFASWLRWPW